MRTYALALSALLVLGGTALAGGGGKIKWRPGKEHDAALAEAKRLGVPVVLYFTGEG